MYSCFIFFIYFLKIEPKTPWVLDWSMPLTPRIALLWKRQTNLNTLAYSKSPVLSVLWNCDLLNTQCYQKGHYHSQCVSYLFHCCDEMTEHSYLRKVGAKGLFELTVEGSSPLGWETECGRSLKQLVLLHLLSGKQVQAADSPSSSPTFPLSPLYSVSSPWKDGFHI